LIPTYCVQDYEAELRKYMEVEQAVAALAASTPLGPLLLDAAPLKASLRSEAAAWKSAFARKLHGKGAENLTVGCFCLWYWC
jgi:hypothetical protein